MNYVTYRLQTGTHPDLLLRNSTGIVEDPGWPGEYLLNIVNSKKVDSPPPAVPEKDAGSEAKSLDGTKTDEKGNGQEPDKKDGDSK